MFAVSEDVKAMVEPVAEQISCDPDVIYLMMSVFTAKELELQKQLSPEVVAWRVHDQALWLFREKARERLKAWGIASTRDIGQLLFELQSHSLFSWGESESVDDYADLFCFEDEFQKFKHPRDWYFAKWSLSTMFIVTTLVAVAVAAIKSVGLQGLAPLLVSSWFTAIGLALIVSGVESKGGKRWWLLGVGGPVFCIGMLLVAACLYL